MTFPGPGDEPYAGPPPTRRPERWEGTPAHWPPVAGPVPWGQPVKWAQPEPPPPPPPVPAVRWAPPPGTPPHDVPQPYLLAMRSRDWGWWRPLLGLLLLGVVYTVAATLVVLLALATGVGTDFGQLDLADPLTLLVTNLTLIVAIPVVWLAWVASHGMSRGWSSSVLARLRWRLVGPFALLALGTLGAGIGLSVLASFVLGEESPTGPVASFGWLLVVVVLTTPLQSAAEEYLFRGYLSQSIAAWVRTPRAGAIVAGVVTAALFSLAHLPGDLPTFLDRFAFGLAASAVVWLTGGLEASIVLHAVNNVLVFVLAGALGDGVATEQVPDGPGLLFLLVSVASVAAYVVVVRRSRHRLRPETRTAALDLRTPGVPVPIAAG
jgi:membrane protease YdiL (CAAX protease family)